MTNKEEKGDSNCDPRIAGLLAVHLVSQVLDEAYVIANAASESGQPWRYFAMLKSLRSGPIEEVDEGEETFTEFKNEDEEEIKIKIDGPPEVVATSTPQKVTDEICQDLNETSFIGQGDEEADMRQDELTKSTSMFINHLFDMSEVERVIICDDTEVIQGDSNDLITEAMTKIMESYVNTALGIAFGQGEPNAEPIPSGNKSPGTEHSGYSFLSDAGCPEYDNDIAFCEDDEPKNHNLGVTTVVNEDIEQVNQTSKEEAIKKDDVAFYENTYLTLNRDYDQCSDDDGDPVLQDPKGILMQEVELMAAQTSDDNTPRIDEPLQKKSEELATIPAVSASASGSRKSSLVQRCRSHGARLLACLRGWWRRKTPGKRKVHDIQLTPYGGTGKCKESRAPGSMRGLCPLSPDARRRASSLLDQRKLCSSPPPAQNVVWKFNTVSEALVNSSRWKNYTFDDNPVECGEY